MNSAHPGWVKTEMGGDGALMEIVDGAKTSVQLATLPEDGPTGGYFHMGEDAALVAAANQPIGSSLARAR